MILTDSSKCVFGFMCGIPTQSRNSDAPQDIPKLKRPFVISDSVAASIAISAGWIVYGFNMQVPSLIFLVLLAKSDKMTGALRRNKSLLIHNWSNPRESACMAIFLYSVMDRSLFKRILNFNFNLQ